MSAEVAPECPTIIPRVLAYGQEGDKLRWIAYGTLLTDNTGDGFSWLQWVTPAKQDGQAQVLAGQGSGGW